LLFGGLLIISSIPQFKDQQTNIYDVFALSLLIEKAGGSSSIGLNGRCSEKKPVCWNESTSAFIGSSKCIKDIESFPYMGKV